MKKLIIIVFALVMLTAAAAADTVTVTSMNADRAYVEVEVPMNPQRVAVLDMPALDMLDRWGLGGSVIGIPKGTSVNYLADYFSSDAVANIGTLHTADMEALIAVEPDIIFVGGRGAGQFDELSKIAPTVYFGTDMELGLMASLRQNAMYMASIFGMEEKAEEDLAAFEARVAALAEAAAGKTAVIGIVTSASFNTLGNGSRASLISNEVGFENLANDVDSTHGNEASFELLVELNPDYIFVLDRDSAIAAEGAQLAQEVMDNELVHQTDAYKNGTIVYLDPTAWYLAEGGLASLDIMLTDLEEGIMQ